MSTVARERGRRGAGRRQGAGRAASWRAAATSSRPWCRREASRDRVAQEEVFGPFVTVLTFKDDDEALAIANGTDYGLGSGLWTRDLQRAHRVARELHAGMVWINSYKRVNPGSPFGGVGQSRLRPRDGLRCDARVHPGQERLGQRRRADPAVVPRAERATPMTPFTYASRCPRASCSAPARCSSSAREIERARRAARARALDARAGGVGASASPSCSASARPASSPQARMHVPIETARAARDEARAARRRLRRGDRRRLDHRPRQGHRARLRPARSSRSRPPTPAAR